MDGEILFPTSAAQLGSPPAPPTPSLTSNSLMHCTHSHPNFKETARIKINNLLSDKPADTSVLLLIDFLGF